MSAATVPLATTASGPRLSAAGIVRSEWIKLRTVRSTVWSYAVVVAVSLGLAILMPSTLDAGYGASLPAEGQISMITQASTFGVFFGQLVVAVLGVLVIGGEYSTGMIRSTLTAVPRRLPALWAKTIVLFVTTFVVGAVSTLGAFLVASPIMASKGFHGDLLDDGILLSLLGGALYLALIAVFALGVGTIVRNTAGGIAVTLGTLLILPTVLQVIPASWAQDALPYLLSSAGTRLVSAGTGDGALDPGQAVLVVLAWVAASVVGAVLLLKRRDA